MQSYFFGNLLFSCPCCLPILSANDINIGYRIVKHMHSMKNVYYRAVWQWPLVLRNLKSLRETFWDSWTVLRLENCVSTVPSFRAESFLLSDYTSRFLPLITASPPSLHRKRQTFIKCEQTNSILVPKLENLLTKAISNLGQFAGVTLIFRTTGLRARSISS